MFSLNAIPLVLLHRPSTGHCLHFLHVHSFEPMFHNGSSSFQGAVPTVLAAFLHASCIRLLNGSSSAQPYNLPLQVLKHLCKL